MNVDALFPEIYPGLFRYVHRLTGEADTAEEIAQEAFVRLLSHPLPDDEVRPWLFAVATNLVRDGARRVARHRRLLVAVPQTHGSIPQPDKELESSDAVARVRAVLDELPARDRQMLLMREEGFRYEEIAQVVGVAPGSVGTLLTRALRKFKDAYGEYEDGDSSSE